MVLVVSVVVVVVVLVVMVVVEAGVCGRGWPCNRSGVGLVVVGGRSG